MSRSTDDLTRSDISGPVTKEVMSENCVAAV
jgi:hypothetical protein